MHCFIQDNVEYWANTEHHTDIVMLQSFMLSLRTYGYNALIIVTATASNMTIQYNVVDDFQSQRRWL